MSWTAFPPFVTEVQLLTSSQTQQWSECNLPVTLVFHKDLVLALCYAFGVSERELCQCVEKQFSDELDFTWPTVMKWLECSIISPQEFHRAVATDGCPVDGLFIWLASVVMQTHLNFVHKSSIWTSWASDCLDMMDAAVLYSESGFLAVLHSHSVQEKEELPNNFFF